MFQSTLPTLSSQNRFIGNGMRKQAENWPRHRSGLKLAACELPSDVRIAARDDTLAEDLIPASRRSLDAPEASFLSVGS